jgi:hypothetical protein
MREEVTKMKARLFRLSLAVSSIAMLIAVSGAAEKWR